MKTKTLLLAACFTAFASAPVFVSVVQAEQAQQALNG